MTIALLFTLHGAMIDTRIQDEFRGLNERTG